MSNHLTPLQVCEALIGPLEKIGLAAGLTEKAPYRWRNASQYRDAGDIPLKSARKLLAYAAARGVPLKAEHMVFGAPKTEVEFLRWQMTSAQRFQPKDDASCVAAQ